MFSVPGSLCSILGHPVICKWILRSHFHCMHTPKLIPSLARYLYRHCQVIMSTGRIIIFSCHIIMYFRYNFKCTHARLLPFTCKHIDQISSHHYLTSRLYHLRSEHHYMYLESRLNYLTSRNNIWQVDISRHMAFYFTISQDSIAFN